LNRHLTEISDILETGKRADEQGAKMEMFYRGYQALTKFILVLTLVNICLGGGLLYIIHKGRPSDRYFAMSFNESVRSLTGLPSPAINRNAILSWVGQASADIMTLGFHDISKRMKENRHYFTDIGWGSFSKAMQKSKLIKVVTDEQQIMTAVPAGQPQIVYQGIRQGNRVWDIKVPIVMTVRAGKTAKSARPTLIVTVVAIPTQQNPGGLGIGRWIMF
jgi:intracellular multiplication protein IcmL